MREIRQVKRFGCSWCKITGSAVKIKAHEPTCFYNPERSECECELPRPHLGSWHDPSDDQECPWCLKYGEFISGWFGIDMHDFRLLSVKARQDLLSVAKTMKLFNCPECGSDVLSSGETKLRCPSGHWNSYEACSAVRDNRIAGILKEASCEAL
jgi:hypothetical protein